MIYAKWGDGDVCAYKTPKKIIIEVAKSRISRNIERVEFDPEKPGEFSAAKRRSASEIARSKREPIGLEFDGQIFNEQTALGAMNVLILLRQVGYRVPQSAIDLLGEEVNGTGI